MSCRHGNPDGDCEECEILDDLWEKGCVCGQKIALESLTSFLASEIECSTFEKYVQPALNRFKEPKP